MNNIDTSALDPFARPFADRQSDKYYELAAYAQAAVTNFDEGFQPYQTFPAKWYNSIIYILTKHAHDTVALVKTMYAELKDTITNSTDPATELNPLLTNQLRTAIQNLSKLNIATASILGGIKSSSANWDVSVNATTGVASVNTVDASTSAKGIVQLYDGVDSTDTTKAATAAAVKRAYENAGGISSVALTTNAAGEYIITITMADGVTQISSTPVAISATNAIHATYLGSGINVTADSAGNITGHTLTLT